jgi:hypothetical protein
MNRKGFKGTREHSSAQAALWRQSRSLFIRTMTVGPGITPGLLTLSPITAFAMFVAKRSRAMRIARNYRRWGITPRPENVFAALCRAAQRFYHIFSGRAQNHVGAGLLAKAVCQPAN